MSDAQKYRSEDKQEHPSFMKIYKIQYIYIYIMLTNYNIYKKNETIV